MKKLYLILSILSGIACADNPYLSKDSYIFNDTHWQLRGGNPRWVIEPGQKSTFPLKSHMQYGMIFVAHGEQIGDTMPVTSCDIAEHGIVDGGLLFNQYDTQLSESSTCTYDPKTKQYTSITVITDHNKDDRPGVGLNSNFPQIDAIVENKTPYTLYSGELNRYYMLAPHTTGSLPLWSQSGDLEFQFSDGSKVRWMVSCNKVDVGIYQVTESDQIDPRFGANLVKCEQTGFFPNPERFAETVEIVDLTGK
jgi:hypothetical protein